MRTLAVLFLMAGGGFAQDQAPAQGQFFPPVIRVAPLPPLMRISPLKPTSNPPAQSNFIIRDVSPLSPAASARCAVPLIEMKAPDSTDAIARTVPQKAVADSIAVAPPVPSCGDAVATKAP